MRSNRDFIEVHGLRTKHVQLINKRAIVFVVENPDDEEKAIIKVSDVDRAYKVACEESYMDVAKELLWPNGDSGEDKEET